MMKRKSITAMLLALVMVFALTACGKTAPAQQTPAQPGETLEEVEEKIEAKLNELYDVLDGHAEPWSRLLELNDNTVSKNGDDGSIYYAYLKAVMEKHLELFSEEEQKDMRADLEKLLVIEEELLKLEEVRQQLLGPEDLRENPTAEFFPTFEGQDLDGKAVTSELFKNNKVTVVNFWFSACAPCVGELDKLNELNEQLREKGGEVIGINVDTLDGNEAMISEAKSVLEQKGAVYRNIRFAPDSEAGRFAAAVMAFPTTYVIDADGRIVGEALMGAVDSGDVMEQLQAQIRKALGETGASPEAKAS